MTDVLLITGGSRGIGAATARQAAAAGYRLAINYRNDQAAAEGLAAEIRDQGGQARAFQADVAHEEQIVRLFEEVCAEFGSVGALVNSAGIDGGGAEVASFEATALADLMAVNVIGTMICCREAVRRMSTKHGGAGGAIVNVSSMAATIGGRPGRSHYAASKAAVDAFTVGLAKEVATEGIRVNTVRPGVTLTDMTDRVRSDASLRASVSSTIAMNRVAEADEIAAPILWLLSPKASFVSGCRLDASGGGFVIGAD